MKKRWRGLLVLALIVAFFVGILGWRVKTMLFDPRPGTGERVVLIPTGADLQQVLDTLDAAGLIGNAQAFHWLLEKKNYAARIKPGRYVIPAGTSADALVDKLRSGEQDAVMVTFNNIKDLARLAGRVSRYIETDSVTLLNYLRDPGVASKYGFGRETFIGMFIPDTYSFYWNTSAEGFVQRMAREYKSFWTDTRKAQAKTLGLSQTGVSTLASIVQAETGRMADAPLIAGVYLNRLRINMPLQADPTLKYALGIDSVSRVLDVDKQVVSPYNTYKVKGLPPGPINLPERRFIDAVLTPTKHEYLYFCAREDLSGYSNFARTYDQHLVNARRYQKALNARGIYR